MGWLGPGDARWNTRVVEQALHIGGRRVMTFGPTRARITARNASISTSSRTGRLCFAETVLADGARISVSLVTIQFDPSAGGTGVIVTDQLAFLDGGDTPEGRRRGWSDTIGKLDALAKGMTP